MAVESTWGWDASFSAASDLSAKQFRIVKTNTVANQVDLCIGSSGGTAGPFGVLANTPTSGQAATVRLFGESKCIASSSAISIGAYLTASTDGGCITAVTTGALILARARSSSAAVGDFISVDLLGRFIFVAGATA